MDKSRQQSIQGLFETAHKIFHGLRNETGFPFKRHQLSGSQLRIVFLVAHQPNGLTVKEIAENLEVTSGAVTQLIDELVKKEFVTRSEDKTDRRIIRVALSKKTQAIFHDIRSKFLSRVSPLFDGLTDQEIETLSRLLMKIHCARVDRKECNV